VVDGRPTWDPEDIADHVLSDPPPQDAEALQAAAAEAAAAVETIIEEGLEAAMTRHNR
jgi:peptidyl-tRNA hydrolase